MEAWKNTQVSCPGGSGQQGVQWDLISSSLALEVFIDNLLLIMMREQLEQDQT